MALYVDSAYVEDIVQVASALPLAGVTCNPSIVLAACERGQRLDELSLLKALLESVSGTIFFQPGATRPEEMLRQASAYLALDPQRIIPKIPLTQNGLKVALTLKQQSQRVAFTAVTSLSQAYIAAMSAADYIIPYHNRLERSGIDASERVAQMAELLHNHQAPTRILVASIKSVSEAGDALLAGAHDLTVPPQLLLDMVSDSLTEEATAKFFQDWEKSRSIR